MIHSYLKIFLVENYKITIKIGDMIDPDEKETIEEYRDRVYDIMNNDYKNI
jgi:predicted phosphodiesterase